MVLLFFFGLDFLVYHCVTVRNDDYACFGSRYLFKSLYFSIVKIISLL